MHLIIAKASDPVYETAWLHNLNNLKIPFEGNRKGYCIPFVEEIKFYQVRIKEECAPALLRYVNAIDVLDEKNALMLTGMFNSNQDFLIHGGGKVKKVSWFKRKIITCFIRFIRWLLSKMYIVQVKTAKEGQQNNIGAHANVFNLGAFKDTRGNYGEEL